MDAPLVESRLGEVLDRVAERTPAPGAGSSLALTCALAAALVEMTARFDRSAGAAGRIERAQELRRWALQLAETERHSYEPVLAALRLDRSDPERSQRIAQARATASGSPLNIARAGSELAALAAECAEHTSPHLLGEALAAARLAAAASRAAAEIVEINLRGAPGDPRLAKAAALVEVAEAALQGVAARQASS